MGDVDLWSCYNGCLGLELYAYKGGLMQMDSVVDSIPQLLTVCVFFVYPTDAGLSSLCRGVVIL